MTDRYSKMSKAQLVAEMEAWQAVSDAPKDRQGPSNAARDVAGIQFALAEAWYYRAHDRREEVADKELIKRLLELERAARNVVNQDAKPEYKGRYSELRALIGNLRAVLGAGTV